MKYTTYQFEIAKNENNEKSILTTSNCAEFITFAD